MEIVLDRNGSEIAKKSLFEKVEAKVLERVGYSREEILELLADGNHAYIPEQILTDCIVPAFTNQDNAVIAIQIIVNLALQNAQIDGISIVMAQTLNESIHRSRRVLG